MSRKRVEGLRIRRHMQFRPDQPYNALPLLPPNADLESRVVLKTCIEARAALASLRMAGQLIPNQAILINSIPLLEAQASSEIENIVTTTDRLFRFADAMGDVADPATKEALRYRTALSQGFASLQSRPLTTRTAVDICRTIKGVDMDVRSTPGTALLNEFTGEVVYTPPDGSARIRDLLSNWERYLHEAEDIDPLVRMAVSHYQFEAIHPFTDGNGRTGRVLNLLFLVEQGLLDIPVLYLSRHIIRHKADYYRLLQQVTTEQAWEKWIVYMLLAVRETAEWTTARITAIRHAIDTAIKRVRNQAPRAYSRDLVDLIFLKPYCRIGDVVSAGLAHRQTASANLKALVEIGVLNEIRSGREKLFINPVLLEILSVRPSGAA